LSRGLENKPRIQRQTGKAEGNMPTKHIDEETWRKVEQAAVKATIATKKSIKETQMLKLLILKGLEEIGEEDFLKILRSRKEN
jgi:hypothetical protein